MDISRQRQLVLAISIGMTAMLLGGVVGGLTVSHVLDGRGRNSDTLPNPVKRLDDSDGDTTPREPPALVRVVAAERKPVQPLKPIIFR